MFHAITTLNITTYKLSITVPLDLTHFLWYNTPVKKNQRTAFLDNIYLGGMTNVISRTSQN